ncbi:MAG: tetratricopeptide repeat protein [Ignavibacteriales bacterium]|nr:tetratricopeptide repeat protein [Ignavibacteriales bacterium]
MNTLKSKIIRMILKRITLFLFWVVISLNQITISQNIDSLQILISSSTGEEKVDLLNFLAKTFYYSNSDSTIFYAKLSIVISEQIEYSKGLANAYDCLGAAYNIKGEYEKSLMHYLNSLKIREEFSDTIGMSDSYFNIATSYYHSGNLNKAIEYCQNSLLLSTKINYKIGTASSLDLLGTIFYELNDLKKALSFYEESLKIERELDNKQGIVISLSNIADILDEQGNYPQALKNYFEALEISKSLNDKIGQAIILNNVGWTYLNLQNYSEAKKYFSEALNNANEMGDRVLKTNVYESFSEFYSQIGDYQKSLFYFKNYTSLKDSLFNEIKSEQIADMREKYQTEKIEKDKKILELTNKELETTKIYLISGIVLLFLISTAIYYRIKLRQKIRELQATEKILRVQMNPHFISNSLVAVQNYLMSEDIDNSIIYISNFSDLMRRVIQNSELEYITLAKEIEELRAYLELEKLSLGEKFDYQIVSDEALEINDIQIPPMLIQPYLENSILHGFTGKEENCLIKLSFSQNENNLVCTIEDNGIGREESAKRRMASKKYKSIGQRNVERRIQLINKLYRTNFRVSINDLKNEKSEPQGTRVELNILIS